MLSCLRKPSCGTAFPKASRCIVFLHTPAKHENNPTTADPLKRQAVGPFPQRRPAAPVAMNSKRTTSRSHHGTGSSRTLVISDVHMRWTLVDEIIAALAGQFDQIVFLGDFFDRPPAERGKPVSKEEAEALVAWLGRSLAQEDRRHLVGNHDLSYFAPCKETYCSGTTVETRTAIEHGLSRSELLKLRAATQAGAWLLSHAGFHTSFGARKDAESLVAVANTALHAILGGMSPFPGLFGCGWARFGDFRYGGVTWCDWDIEFKPVRGLHQVMGHTYEQGTVRGRSLRRRGRKVFMESIEPEPGEAVIRTIGDNDSCNWCIDTGLEVVAILEEDTIRFVRWRAP